VLYPCFQRSRAAISAPSASDLNFAHMISGSTSRFPTVKSSEAAVFLQSTQWWIGTPRFQVIPAAEFRILPYHDLKENLFDFHNAGFKLTMMGLCGYSDEATDREAT
jgi:hypothetical protein